MNPFAHKSSKHALTLLVVVLIGYGFYFALTSNWQGIQGISLAFDRRSWIAILLFAVATLFSGYLWGLILNKLTHQEGKRAAQNEILRVHIASWLMKYIPGQVGSLINKVVWGHQQGYKKNLILVTFIYENIFLIIISFIITIPILLFSFGEDIFLKNRSYLLFPALILIPALMVVMGKNLHHCMNGIYTRVLKKSRIPEYCLSGSDAMKFLGLYIIPRAMNGLAFVMIVMSFWKISFADYLPLAMIYILAGAVGMMALFVPSGIGVREAIIVLLCSQMMPLQVAIIVAVVARFYTIVADGLLAICYASLKLRVRSKL